MGRDNSSGFYARNIRRPRITSQYYINLRSLSKLLEEAIQSNLPQESDASVLDLGCGEKPYQAFFIGRHSRYVGVDIDRGSLADIIAFGESLPFKDASFDLCLCTEVYEHVNDPYEVTVEVNRVLKENGILILSAPGIMPVHGYPSDYWRWTADGFRRMLSRHFFDVEVQEVTTPLETLFQVGLIYLPASKLGHLLIAFMNRLVELFGRNPINSRLPRLISLYLVVARKRQR